MPTSLTCPSCGAALVLDNDQEYGCCTHCGSKVLVNPMTRISVSGSVSVAGIATPENLLLRADQLLEQGQVDRAEEYYERVLDLDANSSKASIGLVAVTIRRAMNFEAVGDIDSAESQYKHLLTIDPGNDLGRAALARISKTIYEPNLIIVNKAGGWAYSYYLVFVDGEQVAKVMTFPTGETYKKPAIGAIRVPVGDHSVTLEFHAGTVTPGPAKPPILHIADRHTKYSLEFKQGLSRLRFNLVRVHP